MDFRGYWFGKHRSEKTKKKISITRKKLIKKGIIKLDGKNNPFYGKKHTLKWKQNVSKKLKQRGFRPPRKEVNIKIVELGYLFGVLYGDGSLIYNYGKSEINKGKTTPAGVSAQWKSKSLAEYFYEYLKTKFPKLNPKIYQYEHKRAGLVFKVTCYSATLAEFLTKYNWQTYNWQIPTSFFKLNKKFRIDLIRGFFDSESSIKYTITANSVSKKGLSDVEKMLKSIGFGSEIKIQRDAIGNRKKIWRLKIKNKDRTKFAVIIGSKDKEKTDKLKTFINLPI